MKEPMRIIPIILLLYQIVAAECVVSFNVSTLKYHNPSCRSAVSCTKNCVVIPIEEAKARGGIPCKVCKGKCSKE
jgi:methylphosphotriester-DNA--protein-cysteine methyltransferase